jgi:hypothetical protein
MVVDRLECLAVRQTLTVPYFRYPATSFQQLYVRRRWNGNFVAATANDDPGTSLLSGGNTFHVDKFPGNSHGLGASTDL